MPKYINLKTEHEGSYLDSQSNEMIQTLKNSLPEKAEVFLKIERVSEKSKVFKVLLKVMGLKKPIVIKEVGRNVYNLLALVKNKIVTQARRERKKRRSIQRHQKRWQQENFIAS